MSGFLLLNSVDVITAIIIDLILGDPSWLPHPVIYIGKLINAVENKARAISKNDNELRFYGGIMVIIVASVCFLLPAILLSIAWRIKPLFHTLNIAILWTTCY